MATDKYDLHTIDYSVQGWDAIMTTDMEKLDDIIQTRTLITLESATEAYKVLGLTSTGTFEKKISITGNTNDIFCISIEAGTAAEIIRGQMTGLITNAGWSWNINNDIYLSDTVSGTLTQSAPAIDPQRIGVAVNTTTMLITEWGAEAIRESGNTSVVSGTNTITTSFVSNQADTNYRISTNLINTTDDPPSFYDYITSIVTVSGFTTLFDNNVDSSNYSIDWHIVR